MTTSDLGSVLDQHHTDHPIPTGFGDLDDLTGGGLRPGDLAVIAGYPGMGSSTLALDLARNAAIHHDHSTYFASLESTAPQTARRILAAEGRVSIYHLTAGLLANTDEERLIRARQKTDGKPLHVTARQRDLDAIVNHLPQFGALRMLVVDGAHLLVPANDYGGRAQFADDFARDLKELAVTRDMVVIATLPLEFPFATRTDPRPLLRDFGKRQSFAAAADIVILLHREDAYERASPRAGEADLIVAKHRNGPTATITVAFQGYYARFVDMAQS
jgi:replicative DNA helicase